MSGKLHYKAPKGVLTQEEINELKRNKDQLISLLDNLPGPDLTESKPGSYLALRDVPLTFVQLARWNSYKSGMYDADFITSAFRVKGKLNIAALRHSVAHLIRRHDALRTRISVHNGVPVQEVIASRNFEIEVDSLITVGELSCETEVAHCIEKHVQGSTDVASGEMFRVQLLMTQQGEYILVLSMHHIVSDGASKGILLQELLTAYNQAAKGDTISLPPISLPFAEYAIWQRNTHEAWIARHSSYWDDHLKGCRRLRFPSQDKSQMDTPLGNGVGFVPFCIDERLKAKLREWARIQRTTIVMSVFAAYVALVLRWCNTSEAVFLYQIDGRLSHTVRDTVGNFAFPLYLRIKTLEESTFLDLLDLITSEYCRAYEHADFCYMGTQEPRQEFTLNTLFNWVGFDGRQSDPRGSAIELSPIQIEKRMITAAEIDTEPSVFIRETTREIQGQVYFPVSRFPFIAMERFARNIPALVSELLTRPVQRLTRVSLTQ